MTAIPLSWRPTARRADRVLAWLEHECLAVVVFVAMIAMVAVLMPLFVVQDTWLAVVDGRWIAHHGLPHTEQMTVLMRGTRWIDQQWLAQLGLYTLVRAGGFALVGAAAATCGALALGAGAFVARRHGASARSVALLLPTAFIVEPAFGELRTQTMALPLFAATYALLVADSRRPSRSVYLVLPLLVVWANVHGSVVLGAALVALYGVLRKGRRVLVPIAPLTIVASPYGFSLVHYYDIMLVNSPVRRYVEEWQPATLSAVTAGFFVAVIGAVFALGQARHAVSRFEAIALVALAAAGLDSVRNAVWFGLALVCTGPFLVDAVWAPKSDTPRRLNRALAVAAVAIALPIAAVGLGRTPSAVAARWPEAGARAVAAAAGQSGLVLADDRHADWLLWEVPGLEGRVAYDVRFELLSRSQLAALVTFRRGEGNRALAAPYRVLTFTSTPTYRLGLVPRFQQKGFVVLAKPELHGPRPRMWRNW